VAVNKLPSGAGLGLRRELLSELLARPDSVEFIELAPENWIKTSPRLSRQLAELSEQLPVTCHGLSLSLGSPDPLDFELLAATRAFLDRHQVSYYTEHLSYCSAGGHFYDLAPLPFTQQAANYVAERIATVQEYLGRRIGVENISYYATCGQNLEDAIDEAEFLRAVTQQADCDLLLDVNNVHVNGINHGYDSAAFIAKLAGAPVRYLHVAGHYDEGPGLKIDTHGSAVIDPVWQLLDQTYSQFGPLPTLLERDFNIPPLAQLSGELAEIRRLQNNSHHTAEPA
jgi:uncharacterized protein (UPF0276 family)